MPRSAWACGSAMFTMVASRTTISWETAMTASAIQRRGCGAPVDGPALGAPGEVEVVPGMVKPSVLRIFGESGRRRTVVLIAEHRDQHLVDDLGEERVIGG